MPSLIDIQVRNQTLLGRLKAGETDRFKDTLRAIEVYIRARLSEEGEVIETKAALNSLLADIKTRQFDLYDEYNNELIGILEDLSLEQSAMEADAISSAVVSVDSVHPSNNAIFAALRNNPLSIENYSGTPLLTPFIKEFTAKQVQTIQTEIQQGYSQGRTVDQITRAIRGTRARRFKDGKLSTVDRSNRAMVHTIIQHASSQGRFATWKANDDILTGYQWVSTLDSRTSDICRSLDDGRVFQVGKGPLPPIHVSCRSTTIPVVDKRFTILDDKGTRPSVGASGVKTVQGDETYYAWLKRQPKSFQDETIGPTRGALLRGGGLTSDQFAKLQLDKNFQPLTLEEMRELNPMVFENAGV
jgi:SPP1 gp7 family putative phage head morphogenesis protein